MSDSPDLSDTLSQRQEAFGDFLSPPLFSGVVREPFIEDVISAHLQAKPVKLSTALRDDLGFGLADFLALLRDRTWRSDDEIEFLPNGREGRSQALWASTIADHGVLTLDRIMMLQSQKATIYVKGLQLMAQPLREAARRLSSTGYFETHVNAFLSPAGSQSTPFHIDHHDVLAVQIDGSKTWQVEAEARVPNPHFTYAPDTNLAPSGIEASDITLEQGDVLFLPRGTVHRAAASNESSFHLVFGLKSPVWADVVSYALTEMAAKEHSMRGDIASTDGDAAARLFENLGNAQALQELAVQMMKARARDQLMNQYGQVFAKDLEALLKRYKSTT
ncbi:MAG: cupin domain-containing protein [Pseudomonadota bacterium]